MSGDADPVLVGWFAWRVGAFQLKTQQNISSGGAQLQTLQVSFAKGRRMGAGKALGQQSAPRETEIEMGGEGRGGVWIRGGGSSLLLQRQLLLSRALPAQC